VFGKKYIEELKALHQNHFSGKPNGLEEEGETELLGYPISAAMMAEIEKVDLLHQSYWIAEKMFLVVSQEREEYLELARQLKSSGRPVEYRYVPDSTEWGKAKDLVQAFLLNDVIRAIAAMLRDK
jgi:hypothetical protein